MSGTAPAWCTLVRADNPGPMTLEGTNTWLLAGRDGAVVVDPGPALPRHLATVAAQGPVLAAVLTHGHADHAGGAERFSALTGAPVRAFDPGLCRAGGAPVRDGEDLGVPGLRVRVLHTPGHTADSVCLLVEEPGGRGERAVLTGDTVLGRGTSVVAHPDGRLGDYLASLRRLQALGPLTVLPGHGPVLDDLAAVCAEYLRHRADRLAQVSAALASGATTAEDVVRRVYADIDPALWPAAERSVRAQLDYLAGR